MVSGQVHVRVNEDIRCNGIVLTHFWKTHGRGNRDGSEKHKIQLSDMVPLQAGEELSFPFEFQAEKWPLTYHGHYINVDHYVHVAVDVPWSFDPKHEEEYVLLPGEQPAEITGDRGAVIELQASSAKLSGCAKVAVFGILGVFVVMLSVFFLFLIPIFLVLGAIYWVWRTMIASRVGNVELKVPHVLVSPGEALPIELNFTPRKTFSINGITAKVLATEAATSGSGTNATTHRHTVYEHTHTLLPAGTMLAGEAFQEELQIQLPDLQAWSLKAGSNVVQWMLEVRIDMPRFPDWSRKTDLQLLPSEFLTALPEPVSPAITNAAAKVGSSVPSPPPVPPDAGGWSASSPLSGVPAAQETRSAGGTQDAQDMASLLAVIDQIERSSRFGNERSEIIAASRGMSYDVVLEIERVSTTFGASNVGKEYRNGRTVLGRLADGGYEVQLLTVEASNAVLSQLSRGEQLQTLATLHAWDSLQNRLVLIEVPY